MVVVISFFFICLIGALLASRHPVVTRPIGSVSDAMGDFGWLIARVFLAAALGSLLILLPFLLMY